MQKNYGIFPPPTSAQTALNELADFFLGEGWYTVNPISQAQVNTEIVATIKEQYANARPRKLRKGER